MNNLRISNETILRNTLKLIKKILKKLKDQNTTDIFLKTLRFPLDINKIFLENNVLESYLDQNKKMRTEVFEILTLGLFAQKEDNECVELLAQLIENSFNSSKLFIN